MHINKLNELKELTKKIGLCTLGDIQLFQRNEGWRSDNLITALKNYSKELDQNI